MRTLSNNPVEFAENTLIVFLNYNLKKKKKTARKLYRKRCFKPALNFKNFKAGGTAVQIRHVDGETKQILCSEL